MRVAVITIIGKIIKSRLRFEGFCSVWIINYDYNEITELSIIDIDKVELIANVQTYNKIEMARTMVCRLMIKYIRSHYTHSVQIIRQNQNIE